MQPSKDKISIIEKCHFSDACVIALKALGIETTGRETAMATLRNTAPAKWKLVRKATGLEPAPLSFSYTVNDRGEVHR